ncbi:MAG TPA: hypothetical protein VHO46_12180 [Bacteroidales bacterium]|nr:hypothetical protein [Bacteroidales bacterium]
MTNIKFTQKGIFSLAVLIPIFVFCVAMIFINGAIDLNQFVVLGLICIVFLVCILMFSKLTITVNENYVGFSFGMGIFKRRYAADSIKSCIPVKNDLIYGVGIRLIPHGWLYNVSGRYAVELRFKNTDSVVRIGTDQPDNVAAAINNILNPDASSNVHAGKEYLGLYIVAAIILFGIALPAIIIYSGNRDPEVSFGAESLTIKGIYKLNLQYSVIKDVDTLKTYPAIRRRTNGFASGKALKGNFTLSEGSRVRLYVTKKNPPYILIHTNDKPVYLNFSNPDETRTVYDRLNTLVIHNGNYKDN